MDNNTKVMRAMLRNMSPIKAKHMLDMVELPVREYHCILWHDIEQIPIDVVADKLAVSTPTAKRIHKISLMKMCDTFMV